MGSVYTSFFGGLTNRSGSASTIEAIAYVRLYQLAHQPAPLPQMEIIPSHRKIKTQETMEKVLERVF